MTDVNQQYAILRFVQHDDLISKLIVATTCREGGQVAHAEAVMRGGTIFGAFAEGGAQERPLNYDGGKFIFEQLIAVPVSDDQQAAFEHYLRACRGEKYDYTGLGDFVQFFDWHQGHQVFCSALVTDACRGQRVQIFKHALPIHAHGVTPVISQQMFLARDDSKIITREDPIFVEHVSAKP